MGDVTLLGLQFVWWGPSDWVTWASDADRRLGLYDDESWVEPIRAMLREVLAADGRAKKGKKR